ncbi:hypothetical protein [Solimonas sp. K1W22B-7]|uniref:hypothetical protein n=1 Tax=Solimonas sp. K1W22B-7 TaxID=2303331 RepID=UPI0013C4904E|nr:hypothetical protein [Solimonas sp. K1W22B-7]
MLFLIGLLREALRPRGGRPAESSSFQAHGSAAFPALALSAALGTVAYAACVALLLHAGWAYPVAGDLSCLADAVAPLPSDPALVASRWALRNALFAALAGGCLAAALGAVATRGGPAGATGIATWAGLGWLLPSLVDHQWLGLYAFILPGMAPHLLIHAVALLPLSWVLARRLRISPAAAQVMS